MAYFFLGSAVLLYAVGVNVVADHAEAWGGFEAAGPDELVDGLAADAEVRGCFRGFDGFTSLG